MLPAGLLQALGIGIAELVQTSPVAVSLVDILDIARSKGPASGVFSRFRGLLSFAPGGLGGLTPSELYRAAKYWSDMGTYVNKYQGPGEIDPRLAQIVKRPLDDFDPVKRYAYVFDISYTDQNTGLPTVISRHIYSGVPLSIEEARDELAELIELRGDKYQGVVGGGGNVLPPDVTFSFQRFYRYSYGSA